MNKYLLIIVAMLLNGCMSVVNGGLVYIMAKSSDMKEVDTRTYKGIDRCFVDGKPSAFLVAEAFLYGQSIVENPEIMLNPEGGNDFKNLSNYSIAYTYYVIAGKIGDMRAKGRKQWILPNLKKGEAEAEALEAYIDRKYLHSYLAKCFEVPDRYKSLATGKDLLFDE